MKKLAGKLCVSNEEPVCMSGARCAPVQIVVSVPRQRQRRAPRRAPLPRRNKTAFNSGDMNAFLESWMERFVENGVTIADLLPLGEKAGIVDTRRTQRGKQTQLGRALHYRAKGPWYPNGSEHSPNRGIEYRIAYGRNRHSLSTWWLERVEE